VVISTGLAGNAIGSDLTNNGTIIVPGANTLTVNGEVEDDGTITVNGTLNFDGQSQTLTGTGAITLNSGSLGGGLTQASGHSIAGFGQIDATLFNNGIVNANVNGQTLSVVGTSVINNNNLMEATDGGGLEFDTATLTNTGTLQAEGNSSITVASRSINNQNLIQADNGGQVIVLAGTIDQTAGGEINVNNGGIANIGGTFNNQGMVIGGVVTINNGGTLQLNGSILNGGAINNGSGGQIVVISTGLAGNAIGSDLTNNGTIIVPGANTLTVNGNNRPIRGTGTIDLESGGLLVLSDGIGASTQGALSIASGGQLELANNQLFIDYGNGPDPIASIGAWIASGYNGGRWNGNGIVSSDARNNSLSYGIGYADSADPGNPAGLPSGTIEIAYTLLGDADLNRVVNGVDFGILAANFNKAVSRWDEGDFNYDNVVNGIDFADLAANFNKGASGAAAGGAALSDPALVAFAQANGLMADVPEPACSAFTALAVIGALTRRRRTHPSPPA
jgi:hypothetical protein